METQKRHSFVVQFAATCATLVLTGACQQDNQSRESSDDRDAIMSPSILSRISDEKLRDYIHTLAETASSLESGGDATGRLAMAYDANGFDRAAETTYQEATKKAPDEFKWKYLLALRQQKNGDLEGAIASANLAIELDDSYPGIYVRLGNWLLDRGEPIAARAAFQRAIDIGAGPAAELGSVRTFVKTENFDTALKELSAIVSRTNHPVAFRLLSDTWRAVGDEKKAREYLRFASQAKSMWFDDPLVTEMRTHARGKSKRIHNVELMLGSGLVEDALIALRKFDAEEQTDFNVQYHFALAYFQKQMYEVARVHLMKAIELEPVHYPSHLLLASLYQRNEDNIQAAQHLEHVVAIYPKLQIAHQELGFVRLRNGDTRAALESFETAIDLDSTAPNVHYYAGVILGAEGRCDRAMAHFETALALDRSHEKARMSISECTRALNAARKTNQNSLNENPLSEDGPVD